MNAALVVALFVARAISPAPGVELHLEGCGGTVDREQLLRLLRIELRDLRAPISDETTVAVTCAGGAATVSVRSGGTGKSAQIALDLDRSAPIAQQRIVALTVADLVQWAWADVGAAASAADGAAASAADGAGSPAPAPPDPSPRTTAVVVAAPAPAPSSVGAAQALVSARHFLTGRQVLYGAGAGVVRERGGLTLGGDALFEQGVDDGSLAAVTARSLTVAARAGVHGQLGPATVNVAAGGRWGRLSLAGAPRAAGVRGASIAGWGGGPELWCGATLRPVRPLRLGVSAAAGYLFGAVEGQVADVATVTVAGPWLGVRLSLELAR